MDTAEYFTSRLEAFLDDLATLVRLETPTGDAARMAAAMDWIATRVVGMAQISRSELAGFGPMLRLVRPGGSGRVLLLGHLDTVWPVGSWSECWQRREDVIRGPGVYDMKGGVVFLLWLLQAFEDLGGHHPTLEILLTPDEEMGSVSSRPHLVETARRADAVLVLEPATPDGDLKSARRGAGEYVVRIRGRSAHQGVDPGRGVNAVVEAAHAVLRLLELQDAGHGTAVGPNVLRGGTACNVVADAAELHVDVRTWSRDEMGRVHDAIQGLEPRLEGAEIRVSGGWNRPPMEQTEVSASLVRRAVAVGRRVGLLLRAVRWEGASDANIVAEEGVPTLDGLGPVGDGAHRETEHIRITDLPRRLALLYELVVELGQVDGP